MPNITLDVVSYTESDLTQLGWNRINRLYFTCACALNLQCSLIVSRVEYTAYAYVLNVDLDQWVGRRKGHE